MFFDDKHVKLHSGRVIWDGITRPETKDDGSKRFSLKVAFPSNCGDLNDLDQLANRQLKESKFNGTLPSGGYMPIGPVKGTEANELPGHFVVNFKTTRMPDLYDENGGRLDPMQLGSLMYPGQVVDVLCHCFDYDNKQKGIGAGLDGFAIVASAQAPRLNIASGGIDSAGAFGGPTQATQGQFGGGQTAGAPYGGGYGQAPQGQAPQQGGYGQAPQGQAPQQGGYGQAPQGQAPQQGGYGQAPQQNNNFMPNA